MDSQEYLYVVFSSTPYRMGRLIRLATREPYNHVSISLDSDLSKLYAFARRYYRTPLYGGFVTEEPYRYHHKGRTAGIRVCRLPISAAQYASLSEQLSRMDGCAERYLYNHLSALAAPIHRKVRVPDAYTCAEFAVSILSELGFGFSPDSFYSISDIAEALSAYQFYSGEFPCPPNESPDFFSRKPVPHPIFVSLRDIFALVRRKASASA